MATFESRLKTTLAGLLQKHHLPFADVVIGSDEEHGDLEIIARCLDDILFHPEIHSLTTARSRNHPKITVTVTFTKNRDSNQSLLSTTVTYTADVKQANQQQHLFSDLEERLAYNWVFDAKTFEYGRAEVRTAERVHHVSVLPPESICGFVAACAEAERIASADEDRKLHSFEIERYTYIEQLVKPLYGKLVAKVIAEVRALPDTCLQSGDSTLKDVWEEFKFQLQEEESLFFEFYADTIQDICASHLAELDAELRQLLWLWSKAYWDRNSAEDGDELPWSDNLDGEVVFELYHRVCRVASNQPLARDLEEEERNEDEMRPKRDASVAMEPPPGAADPENVLLRLFRSMDTVEQDSLIRSALDTLGARCSFDPNYRQLQPQLLQEELDNHDLDARLLAAWPADWPGQQFVELDNVGDVGEWLKEVLVNGICEALFELPLVEDSFAESLTEDYLEALELHSISMPWEFGSDPDDPAWIAQCRLAIHAEFVAFLRHWRERVLQTIEKQKPSGG